MSAVSQFPPPHLVSEEEKTDEGGSFPSDAQPNSSHGQPLALPAPSTASTDNAARQITTEEQDQLQLDDGSIVRFDKLGPMVVNTDGTLSRIHNWTTMTQEERRRTARVINARNQTRLARLREQEQEQQQPER